MREAAQKGFNLIRDSNIQSLINEVAAIEAVASAARRKGEAVDSAVGIAMTVARSELYQAMEKIRESVRLIDHGWSLIGGPDKN